MFIESLRTGVLPTFGLSDAQRDRLRAAGTPRHYPRGFLVQGRGDTQRGIGIVEAGTLRMGVIRENGSFPITALLGPGQVFGEITLLARDGRTHDMIANSDVEISVVSRERMLALMDSDEGIVRALLAQNVMRLHMMLEVVEVLRTRSDARKLARFILFLTMLSQSPQSLPCRQEDLAVSLGISLRTCARILRDFADKRLIDTEYRAIRILDRDRLLSV